MAQTGYSPISLYYSTTASAAPSAGNLVSGELAVNITDGVLFYKDNAGVVQTLATKAATSGTYTALTITGGTANGVGYLNGSKQFTTGSALTFDGTMLTASSSASTTGNFKTTSTTAQIYNLTASNDANTTIGLGVFGSAAGSFGTLSAGTPFLSTSAATMVQNVQNASGNFVWGIGSTPAEQMRLTSTGLGIGTSSPGAKLDVNGGLISRNLIQFYNGTTNRLGYLANTFMATGSGSTTDLLIVADTSLKFGVGGSGSPPAATFDSSGNLGLRVTPTTGGYGGGLQISRDTSSDLLTLWTQPINTNDHRVSLTNNAKNTGVGTWSYFASSQSATMYQQVAGAHQFWTAGTGTAGNTISFTQALTLDANGKLLVGLTSSTSTSADLQVNAPISLKGYTVAGLPTGTLGDIAYVTDALAPSFLATIVGGGAIKTPVFYNGTNWVAY